MTLFYIVCLHADVLGTHWVEGQLGGLEAIANVDGTEFLGRGDSDPAGPVRISEGKHCIAASCSFLFTDIVEKLCACISTGAPAPFQPESLQSLIA